MRLPVILMSAALAMSGCSAARTAISALSPKSPSVTVVNNVEPSPMPTTVVVVEKKEAPKKRGFFEKVGIVTTTTIVGAGLGALAGDALDADVGSAALLGAAAGGLTGAAIISE
ncbi:MAG: hypothetical protein M4D80_21575 [Myxococcota bacterium]|nr:hypothetical protein [Myxococcota bacterium]